MMSNSALRIFVRTIERKMKLTGETLEEILENDYPKLSEEDKQQIRDAFENK